MDMALIMAIGALLLIAYMLRGYRERLIIMALMLYMTVISTNVYVFSGRVRLSLAILLVVFGNREVVRTIRTRYASAGIVSLSMWTIYLLISHVVIYTGPIDVNTIYTIIGDFVIYLLAVTYIMNSTDKEIKIAIYAIAIGYMTNIIVYVPRVLPILQFIPHSGYYHHGAVGVSCFRVMPFLIFLYKSNDYTAFRKKALLIAFIVLTFVIVYLSGSRTGMIGAAIVLLLYTRNIKTAIMIVATLLFAFQIVNYQSESKFAEDRYDRVIVAFRTGNPRSLEEVDFRLRHFEMSLSSFNDSPIAGNGYGSWSEIRAEASNLLGSSLSAHSAYATLIGETGLIGILLFIVLITQHLKGLYIKNTSEMNGMLRFIILIGIIPFLLMGINSSSFWHRAFIIYLGFANGAKSRGMLQRKTIRKNRN